MSKSRRTLGIGFLLFSKKLLKAVPQGPEITLELLRITYGNKRFLKKAYWLVKLIQILRRLGC